GLKRGARLALFLVSYVPLFLILIIHQLYKYSEYLRWGGLDTESFFHFVKYFGAVSILAIASIFGLVGLWLLIANVSRRAKLSGDAVTIIDIENKNSESISYLFTYLIPFVFQDLSDPISVLSVLILLVVTFLIYTNSSMLLINPTISMWYSLYQIEYCEHGTKKKKKGMILSRDKYLEEHDQVKLKRLGHRLYYSTDIGERS
ncbi:hypothetical protein MNBD_BACTEROID05-778, partial [hydrothermal vent metagenome]